MSSQTPQRPVEIGEPPGGTEGTVRLVEVEEGRCGMVSEVLAGEAELEQLKAMGVCVGRKVMLLKSGDPMILKVLGSRIGISSRLATRVRVVPCGGDMFAGVGTP